VPVVQCLILIIFGSSRLSEILKHQAALLELIVSEQRYYPDYYRVTFFGNFPGAVRGKSIIVRALFIVTYLVAY
jgi:dedicator of cytokinesis protein 3